MSREENSKSKGDKGAAPEARSSREDRKKKDSGFWSRLLKGGGSQAESFEALVAEHQALISEHEELQKENGKLQENAQNAERKHKDLNSELDNAKRGRAAANKECDAEKNNSEILERAVLQVKRDRDTCRAEQTKLRNALKQAKADLEKLTKDGNRLEKHVAELKHQEGVFLKKSAQEEEKRKSLQQAFAAEKEQADTAMARKTSMLSDATAKFKQTTATLDETSAKLGETSTRLKGTSTKLDEARAKLAEATESQSQMTKNSTQLSAELQTAKDELKHSRSLMRRSGQLATSCLERAFGTRTGPALRAVWRSQELAAASVSEQDVGVWLKNELVGAGLCTDSECKPREAGFDLTLTVSEEIKERSDSAWVGALATDLLRSALGRNLVAGASEHEANVLTLSVSDVVVRAQ